MSSCQDRRGSEATQHLAKTKHVVDEMSATNHQTNYLYKRNASYVI